MEIFRKPWTNNNVSNTFFPILNHSRGENRTKPKERVKDFRYFWSHISLRLLTTYNTKSIFDWTRHQLPYVHVLCSRSHRAAVDVITHYSYCYGGYAIPARCWPLSSTHILSTRINELFFSFYFAFSLSSSFLNTTIPMAKRSRMNNAFLPSCCCSSLSSCLSCSCFVFTEIFSKPISSSICWPVHYSRTE